MIDGPKPTRQEYHRVLDMALADLRTNPNDRRAHAAAAGALSGLKAWADAEPVHTASEEIAPQTGGETVAGRVQAFGRGASMGTADELGGITSMLGRFAAGDRSMPSLVDAGTRGQQESVDYSNAASVADPVGTGVANALGTVAGSAVGGLGAARAFPALGTAIGAGYAVDAPLAAHATSALGTGALGAGEGLIRGYFGSDAPDQDRVLQAFNQAAGGGLAGVAGGLATQAGNATLRGLGDRLHILHNNATRAPLQTELTQGRVDQLPLRTTALEQNNALRGARVGQIPQQQDLLDARVAGIGDRATILGEQATRAPDETAITAMRRASMERAPTSTGPRPPVVDPRVQAVMSQMRVSQQEAEAILQRAQMQSQTRVVASPMDVPATPPEGVPPMMQSPTAQAAQGVAQRAQEMGAPVPRAVQQATQPPMARTPAEGQGAPYTPAVQASRQAAAIAGTAGADQQQAGRGAFTLRQAFDDMQAGTLSPEDAAQLQREILDLVQKGRRP